MSRITSKRPSPALVVATVALIAALAGTAVALPGVNSVRSDDIVNGNVKRQDIKNNAVNGAKVAANSLRSADVAGLNSADISGLTGADISGLTGDDVTDNSIADGDIVDLSYTDLALSNGFTVLPGGQAPQFAVDAQGVVHLRGQATQASSAGGSIATLPAGARPPKPVYTSGVCATLGSTVSAMITISTSGTITVNAQTGDVADRCENLGFASIDGVTFSAS